VVLALFAEPEVAVPNLVELLDGGVTAFRAATLAWPAADYTDPLHLLAVLRNRNILVPHVVSAREVAAARTALFADREIDGNQAPKHRDPVDWSSPVSIAGVTWAPKPDPRIR